MKINIQSDDSLTNRSSWTFVPIYKPSPRVVRLFHHSFLLFVYQVDIHKQEYKVTAPAASCNTQPKLVETLITGISRGKPSATTSTAGERVLFTDGDFTFDTFQQLPFQLQQFRFVVDQSVGQIQRATFSLCTRTKRPSHTLVLHPNCIRRQTSEEEKHRFIFILYS